MNKPERQTPTPEEVLRRMLQTPPQPHPKPAQGQPAKKTKKARK